eukprot:12703721-Ditylum_brightwellii.AAC.1
MERKWNMKEFIICKKNMAKKNKMRNYKTAGNSSHLQQQILLSSTAKEWKDTSSDSSGRIQTNLLDLQVPSQWNYDRALGTWQYGNKHIKFAS